MEFTLVNAISFSFKPRQSGLYSDKNIYLYVYLFILKLYLKHILSKLGAKVLDFKILVQRAQKQTYHFKWRKKLGIQLCMTFDF